MVEIVVMDMKCKYFFVLNVWVCLIVRRGCYVEYRVGFYCCEVNFKMVVVGIIVIREFVEFCVNFDGKDFVGKIIS